MSLELGTRRGFLTGLAALITAPAIIKVENLMPIELIDLYNTRYIWDYEIMILRVDRALHKLAIPPKYVQTIQPHIAHKFIPKHMIENLKPPEGSQKYISVAVSGVDFLNAGYDYNAHTKL